MNTKLKGDIGELIVAKKLLKENWHISIPFEESLKYDLIAEKNGVMKRIQIKAVTPKNGVLHINCRSSNNWSVHHYKPIDFEILAAVNLKDESVYFIPSEKIGHNLITLRMNKTKNSQNKNINFAKNFINFC